MITKTLAAFKARQSRGGAWVQIILNMGIITANAALFEEYFRVVGISLSMTIVIGIVGYIGGTIVIGFLDERYGLWRYENEYNSTLNPFQCEIRDAVRKLSGVVKDD